MFIFPILLFCNNNYHLKSDMVFWNLGRSVMKKLEESLEDAKLNLEANRGDAKWFANKHAVETKKNILNLVDYTCKQACCRVIWYSGDVK